MQPPFCEYLHMLERVEVVSRPFGRTGRILYFVGPVWRDVDRAEGTTYGVESEELAYRLRDIILSGRGYSEVSPRRDVEGKSYVSARARFYACDMENSLREIDEEDALWTQRLGQIGRPPPLSEWLVRPVL